MTRQGTRGAAAAAAVPAAIPVAVATGAAPALQPTNTNANGATKPPKKVATRAGKPNYDKRIFLKAIKMSTPNGEGSWSS